MATAFKVPADEPSAAEITQMKDLAAQRFGDFWGGLTWQPIAEYDKTKAKTDAVLLRNGDAWAFGYWGDIVKNQWSEGLPEGAMWRHAQDVLSETAIEFEPTEFAKVSKEWEFALFCD